MEKSEIKGFIAKRVAKELKDGDVVNLGIGLPTLVPNYLPEGVKVTLQSENGIVGTGTVNDENRDPLYVTDAGGAPAAVAPGGAFIDSCSSSPRTASWVPAPSMTKTVTPCTSPTPAALPPLWPPAAPLSTPAPPSA